MSVFKVIARCKETGARAGERYIKPHIDRGEGIVLFAGKAVNYAPHLVRFLAFQQAQGVAIGLSYMYDQRLLRLFSPVYVEGKYFPLHSPWGMIIVIVQACFAYGYDAIFLRKPF